MIKYAHTTDYVTVDYDSVEDETMIPESLKFGTDYDVACEDEAFVEALEWDHEIHMLSRQIAAHTFAYRF
jgi:hypothetical protein